MNDDIVRRIVVHCPRMKKERLEDLIENLGWLRLAESSLDFWNNEKDSVYDRLPTSNSVAQDQGLPKK